MLSGRRAFKANTTVALVLAVTRHEPEPLRKFVPNLDPAVEALVARCIAKDPSQRYADGSAVLEAIEDLVRVAGRSQPDLDDTAADAGGPPVAAVAPAMRAPSVVPRARERTCRRTDTWPDDQLERTPVPAPALPPERLRLFAAIGGGFAAAGLLLILVTVVFGGSHPKATAAPPAASSAETIVPYHLRRRHRRQPKRRPSPRLPSIPSRRRTRSARRRAT